APSPRLPELALRNPFLSGDNAVVIALAVRVLPKRQRLQGQIWGTVGAVGLRMAFVRLGSALLRGPFLRLGGGGGPLGGACMTWARGALWGCRWPSWGSCPPSCACGSSGWAAAARSCGSRTASSGPWWVAGQRAASHGAPPR